MISLRVRRSVSARPPKGLLHPVALAVAPTIGRWLFTKGPRRFIPFSLLTASILFLYGLSFVWPGDPISVLHDLTYFAIGISATLFGTAGGLVGGAIMSVLLGPLSAGHLLNHTPLDLTLLLIQFAIWETFGFLAGAVVETVQAYFARVADAESQLVHAEKMEAIGRLTGGVAHDFNNMLTAIGGYCELIRMTARQSGDSSLNADIEETLNVVRRARELTNQLLAIGRKQVMSPRELDLAAEIGNLSRMLRRIVGDEVRLEAEFAPSAWQVRADPVRLSQVIMNLVVNARDAMPNGGVVRIQIAYAFVDSTLAAPLTDLKPGYYATIAVRDTGHGIDERTMTHLFEPFFTTKEEGKGTGLGLSTSMGIIRQFGGDIGVDSEVGVGTTFKIFLPRAPAEASATMAKEAPKLAPWLAPKSERSPAILVADDTETFLHVVNGLLNPRGFTVLWVPDGAGALSTLERQSEEIALVVADSTLPEITGLTFAEAVKSRFPRTKILLTAGPPRTLSEEPGLMGSFDGFLEKPFTAHRICEAIVEALS